MQVATCSTASRNFAGTVGEFGTFRGVWLGDSLDDPLLAVRVFELAVPARQDGGRGGSLDWAASSNLQPRGKRHMHEDRGTRMKMDATEEVSAEVHVRKQ